MSKSCPSCKRDLPFSYFNWKIKNVRLAVHCKECSRAYIREHYKRNRIYYLKKARRRNLEIYMKGHEYLGKYLLSHPCVDCGEKDILVLEFDHKEKSRKDGEISSIIRSTGSIKKLISEVSKCEVRCANCHRRKTARESKSWKLLWAPVA